jgi:hypothetical protein
MIDSIRTWWRTFRYNYCWSDWTAYIDGWIPRFSLFFPIAGYLILFNDSVSQALQFKELTDESTDWGLSGRERLRFLYYGLLFLGLSNFLYRIRLPYLFRFGTNIVDYTNTALEFFHFGDFQDMHHRIGQDGHISRDGKYYDSEWNGFKEAANNTDEGRDSVQRNGNWEDAKRQYGGLLRSIIRENFLAGDQSRRGYLTLCLIISSFGYILLIIPGVDLFAKVTVSTFGLSS